MRVVMSKTCMIFSQSSNPASSGHTRTNSSKAQSLKGSIVLQKPGISSAFSSTFVSNSNPYGVSGKAAIVQNGPGNKLLDQIKLGLGR